MEPLIALELAEKNPEAIVVFVTLDDAAISEAVEAISYFSPGINILTLPAWDCVPYDRVSPRSDILGKRVAALSTLSMARVTDPTVLVTSNNAFLQRVPNRELFYKNSLKISTGSEISVETLSKFLETNGFNRTGTVREAGEYAFRGGIIDIFPANSDNPVRFDLFGDEIEEIRGFDALTQQSIETKDHVVLTPVSELFLDQSSISRFRTGYRSLFGNVSDDPLYESISAGRRIAGAEHWLPLFCDGMQKITDFIPESILVLGNQFNAGVKARLEAIDDFYNARKSFFDGPASKKALKDSLPYRPIPPGDLYLTEKEIDLILEDKVSIHLSPFSSPSDLSAQNYDIGARRMVKFGRVQKDTDNNGPSGNNFDEAKTSIDQFIAKGSRVIISCYSSGSTNRISSLFLDHGLKAQFIANSWQEAISSQKEHVAFITLGLSEGFSTKDLAILTEQDILGDRLIRQQPKKSRGDAFLADISELSEGDIVVHIEHGLGRYEGLEKILAAGAPHDCLKVSYQGGDRLFVPVENIELLSRFGSSDSAVVLDKLGGAAWQARKSKLKERLREIADQLIKTAAARTLREGRKLNVSDQVFQEFCAKFPFNETDDQLNAISETIADLQSGRPMDRLICGDVGFGKTEVALRAAFSAVMAGGQVALIAPTTLLSRQHYQSFTERLRDYPINIKQLSRLVTTKEANDIKEAIAAGNTDIVIGTHALLGKGIEFNDLALMIVDEEQHFGVNHKERLKQLQENVHVLTLSATPIPRTLQMALSGVKDMSIIATPPVDRLAVRTFVMPQDPVILKEAIMRERFRGGQIFYVCPRIADLNTIKKQLGELVPDVKLRVAHGQMPVAELEEVMNSFYDGEIDLLLSTQIVESGLDIPNANTLIIHRADRFGLAQLYQLRGRIGRSKVRAYCYLTIPSKEPLTENAQKRLEVMQSLDSLGAGFSLASHDLDIRGAGNLLGDEQSGHIKEVGVELYQQMLEEAVAAARSGEDQDPLNSDTWSPSISIGATVLIPEKYITDLSARLSIYRRASALETPRDIDSFNAELIDRFGPLPNEVESLLEVIAIKQLCKKAGIEKLDAGPKGALIKFYQDRFEPLERLIGFIQQDPNNISLRSDQQLVVKREWSNNTTRAKGARSIAKTLAEMKS